MRVKVVLLENPHKAYRTCGEEGWEGEWGAQKIFYDHLRREKK